MEAATYSRKYYFLHPYCEASKEGSNFESMIHIHGWESGYIYPSECAKPCRDKSPFVPIVQAPCLSLALLPDLVLQLLSQASSWRMYENQNSYSRDSQLVIDELLCDAHAQHCDIINAPSDTHFLFTLIGPHICSLSPSYIHC